MVTKFDKKNNIYFKATYCQALMAKSLIKNKNSGQEISIRKFKGNKYTAKKLITAIKYIFSIRYPILCNTIFCYEKNIMYGKITSNKNEDPQEIYAYGWNYKKIFNFIELYFDRNPLNVEKKPTTKLFAFYNSRDHFTLAICTQHITGVNYSFNLIMKEFEKYFEIIE